MQPLAPNNENAFNPCFVSWLYAAFSITFLVLSSTELAKLLKRRSNPTTWFGNLLPRNTGLNYYLRCNAVLIHTACYIGLSFGYLNLHARYADTKIVGFLLLNVLLLLVILPCHILEVAVLPTPSFVLQAFWPLLTILQIVLLYQDAFTKWPVLVGHQNSDPNVLFAIELFLVVNSISICVLESLQWKPTSKLIHEYKLQGLDWELEEPDLYSTLTFAWMNPLIKKAFVNKTLSMDELPDISHDLSAELSTTKLKHFYKPRVNLTKQGATWHLIKLLSLTFGPTVLLALVYELGSLALSFVQPQLLKQLINFFGSQENKSNRVVEQNDSILRGILIALSMFVITLIQTSFDNKFVLYYLRSGLGCRSSLTSLMFQKALKLSSESKLVKSTGDIVTLVSVDVDRIQQITQNIQTIIVAPIELTICLVSLYYMVGWKPALVSFGMLCFMVPLHSFIIRLAKKLRRQQMKYTDLRSRTINEILTSIKSIKLYSWESPMNERLQDVRVNQELKNLKKIRVVNVCGGFLWQILPFLLSFFTFATFVLTLEEPLTSEILFPTLSLLNMLSSPMVQFPMIIAQLVDSGVSVTRVAEFLELAEIDDDLIKRLPKAEENAEIAVEIKDTSFLWEKPVDPNNSSEDRITSVKYALKNINFTARKSYLHCIVGRVGSGKSTFFTSLLGQLEMVNSKDPLTKLPYVSIRGTIAYCAQQPWIMNSSLKDNILFGHKYDEGFYKKTIECCQLIPDISVLPDGDETFVGEKGISLSGGQKARLSLARAVYARSDVYLLDDILSAVDSHVGKQIIEKVLSRELGLLKTKTIILATNSLLVLNYSDSIDLLERGEIVESGKFNEIMSQKESNSKLFNLLSEFGKQGPSHPSSTVTPLLQRLCQ